MFIEFMIDNPKLVKFALAYVGIGISLVVAGPFRSEISAALRHAQPGALERVVTGRRPTPRLKMVLFAVILILAAVLLWPVFLPGVLKSRWRP